MKEICLINKGENIKQVTYKLGLNINNSSKFEGEGVISSKNYFCINEGNEDIIIVRNYNPCFLLNIKKSEGVLDIYEKGFAIMGTGDDISNEKIIIQRQSGVKYNVKPLEKIEDLANKFGVSVEEIIEKNRLTSKKLFIGQILIF